MTRRSLDDHLLGDAREAGKVMREALGEALDPATVARAIDAANRMAWCDEGARVCNAAAFILEALERARDLDDESDALYGAAHTLAKVLTMLALANAALCEAVL
jgi:hypothetical protein